MTDDKNKRSPVDASRINVNEDYELRYWSDKIGCTHDKSKADVKVVGVMAKDVETYLKRK